MTDGKVSAELYPTPEKHNSQVYLYFRYLGWECEQQGRHLAAFFYRDFARQEIE